MTKIDEIYEAVLPEMKECGIADTIENRHDFLLGIRDAWFEDPSRSIEKSLYLMALSCEITALRMKLYTRRF